MLGWGWEYGGGSTTSRAASLQRFGSSATAHVFALGGDTDLETRAAAGEVGSQIIQNARQVVIGALGRVMKQVQATDSGIFGELHRLGERAVSPAFAPDVFVVAEHRIVKQDVDAIQELDEVVIRLFRVERIMPTVQLVVGDVCEPGPVRGDAVTVCVRGVAHTDRIHFDAGLDPRIAAEMLEIEMRRDGFERHREIDGPHLPRDQRSDVDVALPRTVNAQPRIRVVQRAEEWQPLDVVPVEMREKQLRADRVGLLRELLAEETDAATGVEYEAPAARDDFDARSVAPVSGGEHSWTWHRATCTPTPYAHRLVRILHNHQL